MDEQDHNERTAGSRSLAVTAPRVKTIVVNGREHEIAAERIDRDEIARLAFPRMNADRGALTVVYDRGPADAPCGLLTPGRATRVLQGQTFSVSLTDKS